MSALRAPAVAPARRNVPAPRRAPLTALPGGRADGGRRFDAVRAPLQARSGVPFLIVCATVLVTALLAALVLNTTMARGSYDLARLQREVNQASQDVQTKQAELSAAQNTLDQRARQMGMVPADNPDMLDVSGATVPAPGTAGQGAGE
ncbi:hypothetical protein DNL40_03545 [Xylanimonas oleitrophica]|uniref:Cell division protein FtsL n=1 Tax=Xylanimonas oleitrophica TaxID=2607479 RepID=A0A2W5WVE7_9MICO|nr:hypothetical protein [Xylanimonas oleitrophica]PZR55439.1 hypothetical protein DNL40_03545 [Xylanimonas oleitrophica]